MPFRRDIDYLKASVQQQKKIRGIIPFMDHESLFLEPACRQGGRDQVQDLFHGEFAEKVYLLN